MLWCCSPTTQDWNQNKIQRIAVSRPHIQRVPRCTKTIPQVYLVISQCIETFTQLYRGIGGHGGTIEIRALSYAEKNADLPHVSMVERLYSGILSDVLEAIEVGAELERGV